MQVIGKIREFNAERYLLPEIVKKTTKKWLELRKMQLQSNDAEDKEGDVEAGKTTTDEAEERKPMSKTEEVLNSIREFDKGEGAAIDLVIACRIHQVA